MQEKDGYILPKVQGLVKLALSRLFKLWYHDSLEADVLIGKAAFCSFQFVVVEGRWTAKLDGILPLFLYSRERFLSDPGLVV